MLWIVCIGNVMVCRKYKLCKMKEWVIYDRFKFVDLICVCNN